ncbi:MAG: hypothetical protein BZ137_02740, partial [Methanosphaera sp. rholeuAM130]
MTCNIAFAVDDSADVTDNNVIVPENNQDSITKDYSGNLKSSQESIADYTQLKSKLREKKNQTLNLDKKTYKVDEPVTVNNPINLEINGNGAVIDGQSNNGFLIFAGNSLKISNVTFRNFKTTTNAAITGATSTKITITNCTFVNSTGKTNGVNILSRGSLTVKDCTFEHNQATKGSGIRIIGNGQKSSIENSVFKNNYVETEKESIIELTGNQEVTINNCIFNNNTGRAIHSYENVNARITNSKFTNMNTTYSAVLQASVIDNYESKMYLSNNLFENITNTAPRIGGGLMYNEIGEFVMTNNTFSKIRLVVNGTNRIAGGILWNRNSTATVSHNTFNVDVTCNDLLGGVLYNNIGVLKATNNTFNVNVNVSNELGGAAIYNDFDSAVNIQSKLYYGDNSFGGIKLISVKTILNTTIRNKGYISLIGAENLVRNKTAIITITAPSKIDTGMNATFTITATDKDSKEALKGVAIIKINGLTIKDSQSKTIIVTIKNGKGSTTYPLKSYSAKTHNVTAVFSKAGYDRAENSTTMTVNKVDYVMDSITFDACSEKVITINRTIKDSNGNIVSGNNKVAIKINGKTILSTTVTDGVLFAKVQLPYLPSGKLNLSIYLGENFRYNFKQISSTITIHKQNVSVTIENITQKAGQKISIKAKLTNDETKTNV